MKLGGLGMDLILDFMFDSVKDFVLGCMQSEALGVFGVLRYILLFYSFFVVQGLCGG